MQVNFVTKIPKFEKFGIITSESLNLISLNFFNFINAKYINSSDGIIAGFDIEYNKLEKSFSVGKGIVKIDGNLFFLNEIANLDLPNKEGRYSCVLLFKNNVSDEYFENILTIKLIEQKDYKGEFLLFEIILREGADITNQNKYFEEFRDEFNTINIINQKYCVTNSKYSSISPKIMKKWALLASSKKDLKNLDINFIFLCLNSVISKELMLAYIKEKMNIDLDICNTNNDEIIKYLSSVLIDKIKDTNKENNQSEEFFYIN